MNVTTPATTVYETSFARAADSGLKIALIGRTIMLLPIFTIVLAGGAYPSNVIWPTVILVFIATGFGVYRSIGTPYARRWHKYALFLGDVAAVAVAFYFAPLTEGGDPPRIMMFRAYGPDVFYILVGAASLTLSYGLVMSVGTMASAAWLALFYTMVADMETTLSWSDLPTASDTETYLDITLSPYFTGDASRLLEAAGVLFTALLLGFAVRRAKTVVIERARIADEREQIEGLFGRYVPKEVISGLMATDGEVRPVRRVASLLYLDVEGFTALTERRTPEEIMTILSAFFDAIGLVLATRGGTVTNLQGDALVGCFNAPQDVPDHADAAVACARDILSMLAMRRFEGETLNVRIGINTGEVAAGTVGGTGRRTYTVHGDAINVAARLEALNKETGTRILLTSDTASALTESENLVSVGKIPIRGKARDVEVFTLRDV